MEKVFLINSSSFHRTDRTRISGLPAFRSSDNSTYLPLAVHPGQAAALILPRCEDQETKDRPLVPIAGRAMPGEPAGTAAVAVVEEAVVEVGTVVVQPG